MSELRDEILQLYDAWENRIHPHIGQAFESAEPGVLRVMTIGINAYLSPADWPNQKAAWFASWFREGTNPFDRGVARDSSFIANALATQSELLAHLRYRDKDSVYHTNAIKTYLPESIGRHADQIPTEVFARHALTWHGELDVLARHGVVPHVVIVFGSAFWESAWHAFSRRFRPSYAYLQVHDFTPVAGDGRHHANLVEVEGRLGRHHLALLRVRHPAAWGSSRATPEWLLGLPEVRKLLRCR